MHAREMHAHEVPVHEMYPREVHDYEIHAHKVQTYETHAYKVYPHEMYACEMHAHEMHDREMHAYEGFCEDLARQNTVAHPSQLQLGFWRCRILVMLSHMGFHVVAYGFQSPWWRPKGQYLGRCTVCLGTSAHRPCFDLSVCLSSTCLSIT